ncbi:MAG TPA: DUF5663 domain-containing protein [Candidatus Saccharimonadales bacterium]|nr:DUF5663 domain-containing protein [Candidatus Saccharimonadales bacterium]
MQQIDDNFLADLGLGNLDNDKKQVLVQQLIETLQLRVGTRLSEDLTDEQLDDFERTVSNQDDPAAGEEWLKRNNPNYASIVSEEVAKLKDDLRSNLSAVMG